MPARYEHARGWVRPAVAAWCAAWLVAQMIDPATKVWLDPVVTILAGLAILTACRLGRELALRMEEPSLAWVARIVGRSWFVLSCMLVAAEVLAALLLQPPAPNAMGATITLGAQTYTIDPWLDTWLSVPMIATGICFLLLGLWLLILPFTFRRRLRRIVPAGASGSGLFRDAR